MALIHPSAVIRHIVIVTNEGRGWQEVSKISSVMEESWSNISILRQREDYLYTHPSILISIEILYWEMFFEASKGNVFESILRKCFNELVGIGGENARLSRLRIKTFSWETCCLVSLLHKLSSSSLLSHLDSHLSPWSSTIIDTIMLHLFYIYTKSFKKSIWAKIWIRRLQRCLICLKCWDEVVTQFLPPWWRSSSGCPH